jgi:transposase
MVRKRESGSGVGRDGGRARTPQALKLLQERRMRAGQMFAHGKRQVDVAVELGVSAQTASRWHRAWRATGCEGLAGAGKAGRRQWLSDEQVAQVEVVLLEGPLAAGFATSLWTLARVAEVIERVTGVRYSQTQTWAILRQRMGWSVQRPARRAVERDEEVIASWVKNDWPRIKKARGAGGRGSSSPTKADSPSFPS